jgi:hypothetical protein
VHGHNGRHVLSGGDEWTGHRVIVNDVDVELVEDPRHACGMEHLGERLAKAFAQRLGKRSDQPSAGAILTHANEREVVAIVDQCLDQIGQDRLNASVLSRGNVEPWRGNHGDPKPFGVHERTFQFRSMRRGRERVPTARSAMSSLQ